MLPETRAELAVPIVYGDEVLGVLDAQDNQVDGLGEEDSQLLQTIAGQMAVALRNAQATSSAAVGGRRGSIRDLVRRQIQLRKSVEPMA